MYTRCSHLKSSLLQLEHAVWSVLYLFWAECCWSLIIPVSVEVWWYPESLIKAFVFQILGNISSLYGVLPIEAFCCHPCDKVAKWDFYCSDKNLHSLLLMATCRCQRCELSLLQLPSGQGRVWCFVLSQGDPMSCDCLFPKFSISASLYTSWNPSWVTVFDLSI